MRARIHGAAASIGGSCVELEHGLQRLVLDLGLPLNVEPGTAIDMPGIPGLIEGNEQVVGIVLSHGHPDHAGLVGRVPSRIPIYGPASAQRIAHAAMRFGVRASDLVITRRAADASQARRPAAPAPPRSKNAANVPWRPLKDRQPVQLGAFTVTPFAVDHSAFESYALLVEAGGRRLFYSGDLRAHGRKPGMWRRLIEQPPQDVHALLLEGTTLSRTHEGISEQQVEERVTELCAGTSGMVLACYSGQNIDRLVSMYRAARRAGRTLVIDAYGAAIAAATRRATIPQAAWEHVRVFLPHAQRRRAIEDEAFAKLEDLAPHRIYPEELRARAGELVVTMRGSMTRDLDRADCLPGAAAIWSMWPGYLQNDSGARLSKWLETRGISLTHAHASGHARPADLAALATAIGPTRVVPIHTTVPERYDELYAFIEPHEDGIWWAV